MTLHKTSAGNVFISHRSGAILPGETSCKVCGGWNLVTLGIGVDRVHEELKREFPDVPVILFTKDTAPTHKTAKKLMQEFFNASGAILVGTERMLPYLTEPIELVAVASIDSMLSLPAWRAHEQALSILFYLRERAIHRLIIETRKPDNEVMKTISSGNPADFYRADVGEREEFSYPPFSVFIGLTSVGTRVSVEKTRLLISETFKESDLVGPLPAEAVGKNEWKISAVIRVPRSGWPDAILSEKLKSLPPDIAIVIDPDQIV
jgi:primosomal protein N' (replication factor Y)